MDVKPSALVNAGNVEPKITDQEKVGVVKTTRDDENSKPVRSGKSTSQDAVLKKEEAPRSLSEDEVNSLVSKWGKITDNASSLSEMGKMKGQLSELTKDQLGVQANLTSAQVLSLLEK